MRFLHDLGRYRFYVLFCVLYGDLKSIFVDNFAREFRTLCPIEFDAVFPAHIPIEVHLLPDPVSFFRVLKPSRGIIRIPLLIKRRNRKDVLEIYSVFPLFFFFLFRQELGLHQFPDRREDPSRLLGKICDVLRVYSVIKHRFFSFFFSASGDPIKDLRDSVFFVRPCDRIGHVLYFFDGIGNDLQSLAQILTVQE